MRPRRDGPVQGSRAALPFSSRLRRERQRRNWILADVVREIDVRLKDSGVTESLVSAWELGKHRTSARYRAVLCEVFNLPPEALFADQDHEAEPSLGEWSTWTLDLPAARSEPTWSVTSISYE